MNPHLAVFLNMAGGFLPNAALMRFEVKAGTTNEQFAATFDTLTGEAGFTGVKVSDKGTTTTDSDLEVPYVVFEGTAEGTTLTMKWIFVVNGTDGFVFSGGDWPFMFKDDLSLLDQMLKTFHFTK